MAFQIPNKCCFTLYSRHLKCPNSFSITMWQTPSAGKQERRELSEPNCFTSSNEKSVTLISKSSILISKKIRPKSYISNESKQRSRKKPFWQIWKNILISNAWYKKRQGKGWPLEARGSFLKWRYTNYEILDPLLLCHIKMTILFTSLYTIFLAQKW